MSDHSPKPYKTTREGVDNDSVPMQLWRKAKKLGVWDPDDIDLSQDAEDWQRLTEYEQYWLLRLSASFHAGEESVTVNLLPLMTAIADEDRIEEQMFLTSYLWEEAKHLDAFQRFFQEVVHVRNGLVDLFGPAYKQFFYGELPAALNRLRTDRSPRALAEAAVIYQLIAEGVLAESGYFNFQTVLQRRNIMPGMQQIVRLVQRDEARHLAYGIFLLSRLQAEHGTEIADVIEQQFTNQFNLCMSVAGEGFDTSMPAPFGLKWGMFTDHARMQYQKRMDIIRRARSRSIAELWRGRAEL